MECTFDIEVNEPDGTGTLFRPYVSFRIKQLNPSANCMTDMEIDDQVNMLIAETERLRKKAKKVLKEAQTRHDELLRRRREPS